MQLALIKAWQHSLCPTALFTLSGSQGARAAFPNRAPASIGPASLPLGTGEDGEGQQPLPGAVGTEEGWGPLVGAAPVECGHSAEQMCCPGKGKCSHQRDGKLPPRGVLGCSAVPDSSGGVTV